MCARVDLCFYINPLSLCMFLSGMMSCLGQVVYMLCFLRHAFGLYDAGGGEGGGNGKLRPGAIAMYNNYRSHYGNTVSIRVKSPPLYVFIWLPSIRRKA